MSHPRMGEDDRVIDTVDPTCLWNFPCTFFLHHRSPPAPTAAAGGCLKLHIHTPRQGLYGAYQLWCQLPTQLPFPQNRFDCYNRDVTENQARLPPTAPTAARLPVSPAALWCQPLGGRWCRPQALPWLSIHVHGTVAASHPALDFAARP